MKAGYQGRTTCSVKAYETSESAQPDLEPWSFRTRIQPLDFYVLIRGNLKKGKSHKCPSRGPEFIVGCGKFCYSELLLAPGSLN